MRKWPCKPLHEFAEVIRGVSFDKSQVRDTDADGFVPILRAGNIQDTLNTDSDLVFVRPDVIKKEQLIQAGDLAICMSSGSPAIVGKSAYSNTNWKGSVGAFCAIIRFKEKMHHRFGAYWFKSTEYLQWRDSKAKGANIQNLRRSELENVPIPLPPLPEQERIVKLLDQADELRKLRARADKRSEELIPALFEEMFGDHSINISNSRMVTLGDILEKIDSGWSPTCHDRPALSDEWGVLKLGAVTKCQYIDIENKALPGDFEPRPELEVKSGDILFTRKNTYALVAACAFVFETRPLLMLSDLIFRFKIKPKSVVNPIFLWGLLSLQRTRKRIQSLASGSAGSMPNISKSRLLSFQIAVPPLPLQTEFASRVSQIRSLAASQSSSRQNLDSLFQSMLHRAFQGEL